MSSVSIKGFKVVSLALESMHDERENRRCDGLPAGERKVNLSYEVGTNDRHENLFSIKFNLHLIEKDKLEIKLEYLTVFESDDPISKEFIEGHFVNVNAPAIAYPYLRAFVSNLTLNSGLGGIILPTMNFQKHQDGAPTKPVPKADQKRQ